MPDSWDGKINSWIVQKIRVIHLWKDLDTYYGVHDLLLTLGQYIDRTQFDFSLCVFNSRTSALKLEFEKFGIRVHNLNLSSQKNPANLLTLSKFLSREKPHVFQSYCLNTNVVGTLAARLARVPVTIKTELTLKNQAPTALKRFRDKFIYPLDRLVGCLADNTIYVSNKTKEDWIGKGTSKNVTVIHPPFNPAKFPAAKINNKISPGADGKWIVGIVARLSEEKRHKDLLLVLPSLLKLFPKLQLLIVGTGPLDQELRNLAGQLNISSSIEFTGYTDDLAAQLQRMDLFVLPSRTEGLPISIIEAMVMGLPVVATDVGGVAEVVVDGETGILVPARQPEKLAAAIAGLLSNPPRMKIMGELGRKRALAEFHPEKFARKHEALYRTLLEKKQCKV